LKSNLITWAIKWSKTQFRCQTVWLKSSKKAFKSQLLNLFPSNIKNLKFLQPKNPSFHFRNLQKFLRKFLQLGSPSCHYKNLLKILKYTVR
jgi:hypothetical protein